MLTYLLKAPQAVAAKTLQWAVRGWFAIFFTGQLIFAFYIIMLYWAAAAQGQLERWNAATPHLYVKGAPLHNAVFALHIAAAALISLLGPLQLLPAIRRYAPRFHRVSGRFYIFFAFAIGIDGLLLAWRKGAVGGTTDHFIISINALIILVCAYYTIRYAVKRQLVIHNRWAVHLVLGMSGVWLFRVFLMLWLVINQGPAGFDPDTFTGPFLTTLAITVYIFPQVIVWWYFQAREAEAARPKWIFSAVLLCISLGMLVGVFAATMGMWLPRIK